MGERLVVHAGLRPGDAVLDVACRQGATLIPRHEPWRHRARGRHRHRRCDGASRTPRADAAGLGNVEVMVMDGEALTLRDPSTC